MGRSLQEQLADRGFAVPIADAGAPPMAVPTPVAGAPVAYDAGGAPFSPPAPVASSQPPSGLDVVLRANENAPIPSVGRPLPGPAMHSLPAGIALGNAGFKDVGGIADIPKPPEPPPVVRHPEKAASKETPAAGSPGAALQSSLAGGGSHGGGSRWDPFANRTAALNGQRTDLLNQNIGLSTIGEERKAALAGIGEEGQRYADESKVQAAGDRGTKRALDEKYAKLIASANANQVEAYEKTRSGAQKFAGFIAAVMGGFLQGYRGLASNPGLDAMNHAQDTWIKEAREGHRAALEGVRTQYDHFLDATKSHQAASALTHAAMLEGLKARVEQAAVDTQDLEARSHLLDQRHAIDFQIGEYKDAAEKAAHAGGKTLEQILREQKMIADIKHTDAETAKLGSEAGGGKGAVVNLSDGTQARTLSSEAAGDYTQRMMGADKFEGAIKKIQYLRKGHGTLDQAKRKLAEGLAAEAKTAYVQMNGFKRTPNETEFQALDSIVPAHGGEFSFSTDAQLEQAAALAGEARQQAASAYLVPGSSPVQARPNLQQQIAGQPAARPASFRGAQ